MNVVENFINETNSIQGGEEEPPPSSDISFNNNEFIKIHYPEINKKLWNDWKWQIKNRITKKDQLKKFINLTSEELESLKNTKISITPYYLSLIDKDNINDPIRKCVIPLPNEFLKMHNESEDPLHEEACEKVPNLIHRYPDRVLFLTTNFCSTYCRYCTRSRLINCSQKNFEKQYNYKEMWETALNYIRENKNIRDVLLSGGDPLTMANNKLRYLLTELRKITHVEIIRIGTKVPVVLPQRINSGLINMLKQFHPLYISIHFTHPTEITPDCKMACEKLANAGIPLGSQTVLLKDINDNIPTMKTLFQKLLRIRVKPYYLYQCDPIIGSSHFRTSVDKGREIMFALRGNTSGYAIPSYVIDAPGGGGKIPVSPNYIMKETDEKVVLCNYENKEFSYFK